MNPDKCPIGKETKMKPTLPNSEFLVGIGVGIVIACFVMMIITIILGYTIPSIY